MRRHVLNLSVKAPDEFSKHKIEDLLHRILQRGAEEAQQANQAAHIITDQDAFDTTKLVIYKPRVKQTRQLYRYVPQPKL